MKRIILSGLMGLSTVVAWADVPTNMNDFLQVATENPAKVQGASFNFPTYVKGIEVVNVKGSKTAVVELGNDKLNGSVISWGTTKMACLMPVGEAGKLKYGQRIQVKGKVQDIKPYQSVSPTLKRTVNGKAITASCSAGPVVEAKPTPAPDIPIKQDARGFEVGGLMLGMTRSQAEKKLKVKLELDSWGEMRLEERDDVSRDLIARYEMKFTSDQPNGVLYKLTIERYVMAGTMDTVKDAAIKKYGVPDDTTYQPTVKPRSSYDPGKREKTVLYYGMTRRTTAQDRANMSMAIEGRDYDNPSDMLVSIKLVDTPMVEKIEQAKAAAEAKEAQQRADEQKKRDANIKF